MKIAVFVEGQTELMFTRDLLLKLYNYEVNISCYKSLSYSINQNEDSFYKRLQFNTDNTSPQFMIVDVGGGGSVLSVILKREKNIFENGFSKIVALQDIFRSHGFDKSKPKDLAIDTFKNGIFNTLSIESKFKDKIFYNFAIMEIEAWFLGMVFIFEKMDSKLTLKYIKEKTDYNFLIEDPELTINHPTKIIRKFLKSVKKDYKKKFHEIENILRYIEEDDYLKFYKSNKCESFKTFFKDITNDNN